jgi:hypothetical protein
MIVNEESKYMWKEVIIANFKALFWHLPGGTLGKSLKT